MSLWSIILYILLSTRCAKGLVRVWISISARHGNMSIGSSNSDTLWTKRSIVPWDKQIRRESVDCESVTTCGRALGYTSTCAFIQEHHYLFRTRSSLRQKGEDTDGKGKWNSIEVLLFMRACWWNSAQVAAVSSHGYRSSASWQTLMFFDRSNIPQDDARSTRLFAYDLHSHL